MPKAKKHIVMEGAQRRGPLEVILSELIRHAFDTHPGPIVIAVGGPAGSGKSSLARQLAQALEDAAVLPLDDYKTPRMERARRGLHGPHPDANDMALIRRHLSELRAGKVIEQPVYCRTEGKATSTRSMAPARFVLADGEISTYPELRDLIDFSLYIDSDWRTQLATRTTRDIDERGYSADKAIATFLHSNLREFVQHGAGSKAWADVHIYCHEDYRLEIESVAETYGCYLEAAMHGTCSDILIEGLIVPPTTPFSPTGNLAEPALAEHLEFLAANGVRRILVNGTTAEFFSLEPRERKELLIIARRYFPGLIIFNTASDSVGQALHAAQWASDYGADAIANMVPYYFAGAPTDGVVDALNAIAESVDLPTVLYNFTRHTGNAITADMLPRLQHIAIKDSSGDPELAAAATCYLAGTSTRMAPAVAAGAKGYVSALANCMPALYVELESALCSGDPDTVEALNLEIRNAAEHLRQPCEIAAIKHRLGKLIAGYPPHVRLPLTS